jgi:Protein of unknown function (DUF1217)
MDPLVTSLGIPTGVAGWKILQTKNPSDFPALTQDPVVQREIAYFTANAPKALTAQSLLADPRLQDFVLTAYGLSSQNGMTALMQKVLESKPNDSSSFASQMVDPRYTALANAFNYGGSVVPAKPAVTSSAEVQISDLSQQSNFQSFSGTFAGITLGNVDLTQVKSMAGLASSLQTAFQRADGNRSDIKVTLDGEYLKFTDARGRGSAASMAFTPNVLNQGTQPSASAPVNIVAGSAAVPSSGGPAVTSSSFINQVVSKYLESQFEVVVGNSSNALREARYALHQLPQVTSWYSVIADKPLADVVQTLLGLPVNFGALDVTQQANTLSQRMNIKDFQDPQKLSKMLTQFIAMSDAKNQQSSGTTAVNLLNNIGSTSIINITVPTATGTDQFSNGSAAAMVLSTAFV